MSFSSCGRTNGGTRKECNIHLLANGYCHALISIDQPAKVADGQGAELEQKALVAAMYEAFFAQDRERR